MQILRQNIHSGASLKLGGTIQSFYLNTSYFLLQSAMVHLDHFNQFHSGTPVSAWDNLTVEKGIYVS